MTREERDSLDQVIGLVGDLTVRQAIDVAYATGPMRFFQMLERRGFKNREFARIHDLEEALQLAAASG